MAKKGAWVHILRDCLVILSTILMIAMVVLQWQEITTYNIKDHMAATIKKLFESEAPAQAPAAPAAAAADAAQAPAAGNAAAPANAPAAPPAP